ncbi:MAG: carbon monoxide dehydrogenase subunit G [Hyphomicrobiales bacterium]|nr:carbon monoxide dehydrogenase subunit G [Hyphomicrobiales bacterium]MCY4033544.1 carbon monoxide dehydrogenase subunit G [Hyphomicrobiales bacterium]MCY4039079.1 carbon monoxide dehydrogenase subunit G [Hyphomicrobiales bacterium]
MKLSGSRIIPASRSEVWRALNDPETLERILPGAKSIERVGDTQYNIETQMKVGPVAANFKGHIQLSDVVPNERYTIHAEGKGVAGFAKGTGEVVLQDAEDNKTLLTYEARSTVGGKLAQIGQRLIDATATRMTEEFFANLAQILTSPDSPDSVPVVTQTPVKTKYSTTRTSKLIIAATVVVIFALFVYLVAV